MKEERPAIMRFGPEEVHYEWVCPQCEMNNAIRDMPKCLEHITCMSCGKSWLVGLDAE